MLPYYDLPSIYPVLVGAFLQFLAIYTFGMAKIIHILIFEIYQGHIQAVETRLMGVFHPTTNPTVGTHSRNPEWGSISHYINPSSPVRSHSFPTAEIHVHITLYKPLITCQKPLISNCRDDSYTSRGTV